MGKKEYFFVSRTSFKELGERIQEYAKQNYRVVSCYAVTENNGFGASTMHHAVLEREVKEQEVKTHGS